MYTVKAVLHTQLYNNSAHIRLKTVRIDSKEIFCGPISVAASGFSHLGYLK